MTFKEKLVILRKIKGIKRPAIASILPMSPPVLLLDSGANISVTPAYLEQFAIMGHVYMSKMHGVKNPRVAILNNGTEEQKGTPMHIEAYKRLSACPSINFIGNVEADVAFEGGVDVVIADGFVGNVLLKTAVRSKKRNIFFINQP